MHRHHRLDRMRLVLPEPSFNQSRINAVAPVAACQLGHQPERRAMLYHRVAKCPVSNIGIRSLGESVLTSVAFHAPVPETGK